MPPSKVTELAPVAEPRLPLVTTNMPALRMVGPRWVFCAARVSVPPLVSSGSPAVEAAAAGEAHGQGQGVSVAVENGRTISPGERHRKAGGEACPGLERPAAGVEGRAGPEGAPPPPMLRLLVVKRPPLRS